MPAESSESQSSAEMAWVLFMDIVGYTQNPLEKQRELLRTLQAIVRANEQFQRAQAVGDLISLATGDGMALAFFVRDPVAPVKCAIGIQTALRNHPELPLRIGVNTGPVFRHRDIKENINVGGGGVNVAQRVMDCGDSGHILVSRPVADVLEQLTEWRAYLHDLGTCEVKHGVRLQLYNVCSDGVGNAETPSKLKAQQRKAPEIHPPRKWLASVGIAAVPLVALYLAYAYRIKDPTRVIPSEPTSGSPQKQRPTEKKTDASAGKPPGASATTLDKTIKHLPRTGAIQVQPLPTFHQVILIDTDMFGSDLSVDGKLDRTNLSATSVELDLYAGRHTLTIRRGDATCSREVMVPHNGRFPLSCH